MADNTWVHRDRVSVDNGNRVIRTKVLLTVILLLFGGCATLFLNGVGSNATQYQSEGIVIDFGNYKTVWTNISFNETDSPVELLNMACDSHYHTAPIFTDGKLTGIDDGESVISDDATHSWDLWYIEKGSSNYVKSTDYSISASDYTLLSWAYTETGSMPTVGVDATATSIYGYAQPHSLVTLSPVCTELVGAMDAANIIVGTDDSSDYPAVISKGKAEHTIEVVGTYTDPSYEAILHANTDMVFCDASAYSHITMAGLLRNSNINSVVIYDGTDLDTVLNNIFIVGTAMNYELRAAYIASQIDIALSNILALTATGTGYKTLITLSSDPSPFIAGTETYADDIITKVNGTNAINDPSWPSGTPKSGWPNVTPSVIMDTNPECIIIFDYGKYSVDSYDEMISSLSDEWKNTDAYSNGRIYLFTDGLGEMAQRSGPRIAQLTELVARIVTPDVFTDGVDVPKAIGNDYTDYLRYTAHMGFGE
jgi:iron complex transport system substrate-binding protein